jgi:hypothetical protein
MDKQQKLFAFKLATSARSESNLNEKDSQDKWQAQDRDAVAGCTDYRWEGSLRYGTRWSSDNGVYC